jgi:putative phage-type endonuclease
MRKLTEEELEDIEAEIYDEIEEYLETNLSSIFESEFLEKMEEEIYAWLELQAQLENWNMEDLPIHIEDAIKETWKLYGLPLRQNPNGTTDLTRNLSHIKRILKELNEQPAIKQRTKEWYDIRQKCFSASNIWKLFSSQAQFNSLIFEKCNPDSANKKMRDVSNATNSLNWGIKYEPVSIQIYEHKHPGVKVNTDYSCILHKTYPFIGASPDGIVISDDTNSENIGKMVEVKNIYNREITGIPLDDYWVQMQIQMETCDLDECDFLETRIEEYQTEEEFYQDYLVEYKGVILFFLPRQNHMEEIITKKSPFFEYMPLYISLDQNSIRKWIEDMQEKHRTEYILYETVYWKLDEYSCVLVERNPEWFLAVLPKIEAAWKIVEEERENGYQHRAPKSKTKPKVIDIPKVCTPVLDNPEPSFPQEEIPNTIKVIKLSHPLAE